MAKQAGVRLRQPTTGSWKPGQSGNPAGMPPIKREWRERCRELMEAEDGGWDKLADMVTDPRSSHHMDALKLVAAYAYGQPPARTELTGAEGGLVRIVVERVEPQKQEAKA